MADIISLKESVLVYLDRSGGLQKLVEDCKPFSGMLVIWKMEKKKKKRVADAVIVRLFNIATS